MLSLYEDLEVAAVLESLATLKTHPEWTCNILKRFVFPLNQREVKIGTGGFPSTRILSGTKCLLRGECWGNYHRSMHPLLPPQLLKREGKVCLLGL